MGENTKKNVYDISRKDFNEIENMILEDPSLTNLKDNNERLLLHWAASQGLERTVQLLLSFPDSPIDPVDDTNFTPLILATLGGHLNIVKLFLERGADINHKNTQGHSALQYACSKNFKDIVVLLLEKGADVNIIDNRNDTPLHRLASKGLTEILDLFLKHSIKPNLNARNTELNTPLHIACEDEENHFAMMLIENGASIEILNKEKQSPLDVCKPGLRRQIKTKLNIVE